MEPLLRGHPDERPPPLERPLDNVNLNINVLISTPDERRPLLKGHFSGAKGVASQKGFHWNMILIGKLFNHTNLMVWLFVFNVPSTARSFRDGSPIYCPLRRTWSSVLTPFPPGIDPQAVAWQSITLPLRHTSSTWWCIFRLKKCHL